jgi:hypothetical protein
VHRAEAMLRAVQTVGYVASEDDAYGP